MPDLSLKITEIFYSLQGESLTVGVPTVFVRLTGCPLRCQYCDSEYAFHGGERLSIDAIVEQVRQHNARNVCVTGGEPLAQKACLSLLNRLIDEQFEVSLETSGAMPIEDVDTRVSRVVDIKTPDSGEVDRNLWQNLQHLTSHDQLKFVICSRNDYEWARFKLAECSLDSITTVFFSPSFGQVDAADLAQWILKDQLNVRFQLQLHKILWGDEPGR